MPSPQIERKLAAIMFTDIAGYTEQMSKDEAVAISLLETKKKVFRPLLKKYNGKLVKEMGDGTLSHFPSSVDATNCSIELQKSLKKNTNLNVRVGVHHYSSHLFGKKNPHTKWGLFIYYQLEIGFILIYHLIRMGGHNLH